MTPAHPHTMIGVRTCGAALALLTACTEAPRPAPPRAWAPPRGWIEVAAPTDRQSVWAHCANASPDAWAVALAAPGGDLIIRPASARVSDRVTLAVAGGHLVAIDSGEFGGGLDWIAHDAPARRLLGGSMPALAQGTAGVFVIQDLLNDGLLLRLRARPAGRWAIDTLATIPFFPELLRTLPADTLLVVGHGGLSLHTSDGGLVREHANYVWVGTAPNSVVRDAGGIIHVGMRSAVARLVPTARGYRETWLIESWCRREFGPGGATCACIGSGPTREPGPR